MQKYQEEISAPVLVGVTGILSGALEPQLIVTFLSAIFGAGIGMALLPAPPPISSKVDLMMRLFGNIGYVLINSIITMFAMHWLRKIAPGADYAMAFFCAMMLMIYRDKILNALGNLITRKIDGV